MSRAVQELTERILRGEDITADPCPPGVDKFAWLISRIVLVTDVLLSHRVENLERVVEGLMDLRDLEDTDDPEEAARLARKLVEKWGGPDD